MEKPVLSTYKILIEKVFNANVDESWVEWANDMMTAGFESINLYELAGISRPYDQFELEILTNHVFEDLGLNYINKELAIRNYMHFIISSSIDKPETFLGTLQELKNIYINLDMTREFLDFYLLYFAKEDLNDSENQHYWKGANKMNIDQIINEKFFIWKTKLEEDIQQLTNQ